MVTFPFASTHLKVSIEMERRAYTCGLDVALSIIGGKWKPVVIVRRDYQEVPPRVDYEMTDFGRTLARALMPLCAWGDENRQRIEASN